jgi:putative ABC transport system permease protein
LADWDKLSWRSKLDLVRRSLGAFWDALLLKPRRLEDEMFQDLRYGARMLRTHKGFTVVATLTLALGIGANAAMLSVVKSVLLRPLPYAQAERLLQLRFFFPAINHEQSWIGLRDAMDWREQSQGFERIGVYGFAMLNFSEGSLPEAIYGLRVSADLLPAVGVPPALGRYFSVACWPPARRAAKGDPLIALRHE